MITIAASGTPLRTAKYLHTKDTVPSTTSLIQESGDCCFCTCETVMPVFANLSDPTNADENDFNSFIIKPPKGSVVVATLTDLDTATDYVITDDTYGDYYPLNDLKTFVWGFIINWKNVADLIGFGNYQLNVYIENAAGNEILNKDYPKFQLMPYTCENVHNTARMETFNSGYIEGGFDYRNISILHPYTGLPLNGWVQQIRWYGRVTNSNIPTQIDNLSDNYRNLLQVQTMIYNEWNLRLDMIPSDVSKQLIYDNLLADYILLSDYNANAVDNYKNLKTSLLNIENPENFLNKSQIFNIKFVDYKQNLLKRFY